MWIDNQIIENYVHSWFSATNHTMVVRCYLRLWITTDQEWFIIVPEEFISVVSNVRRYRGFIIKFVKGILFG